MKDSVTKELRSGYTTGSCAAAAAKAAALALIKGIVVEQVSINLPSGGQCTLGVAHVSKQGENCFRAEVIKDAGDDPDVTHGLTIVADVSLHPGGIQITGGQGVGTVTKPGLAVPVGQAAINPVPRQMIEQEVQEVLGNRGARVVISVPGGEAVAKQTMNPRLGILGGISILGTGGIVRPMSEEAYRRSLVPQIDQALALGYDQLVLTPGRLGVKKALELGLPSDAIIETSNFIGTMLEECAQRPVRSVLLLGHLGKLVKVAAGIFHTLGKLADARRETITAYAALQGANRQVLEQLMQMNTAEESVEILRSHGLSEVFNQVAAAASGRAAQYARESFKVGTLMYSLSGEVVGYDIGAQEIGEALGWHRS